MATRGSGSAPAGAGTTADLFDRVLDPASPAHPPVRPAAPPPFVPPPPARPRRAGSAPAVTLAPTPTAAPTARHAWLALRLPDLPLDVVAPAQAGPLAVLDGEGARRVVIACNATAARRGIQPGQKLNAAYALLPELAVRERDPAAEERRLQALARWAVRYTPSVSLQPPDALLLEVRGSLRLFGGASALQAGAVRELGALGHACAPALAPTPLAALWLSRARPRTQVGSARLAGALAALPVACTGWPEPVQETLVRLGVRTLGELRRLPRDGLARRFPVFVLAELDEAFGLVPVARRRHAVPERFQERFELPAELGVVEHLQPALERLLERMGRFLRVRDAAVSQLLLTFVHRDRPPTRVPLGRGVPSGAPEAWHELLRERLGRLQLPAPVLAVVLRTGVAQPRPAACEALPGLATAAAEGAGAEALLDRLRARLGEAAVQGVCLVPEHRPESAWRRVRPGPTTAPAATRRPTGARAKARAPRTRTTAGAGGDPSGARRAADPPLPLAPRPLWLLAMPERLAVREGQPYHHGFLHVEAGPERIESGWWDGGDVVRDYYVVVARSGARLWIYRELAPGEPRWFLHGVFG